jgi:hypothetical protein
VGATGADAPVADGAWHHVAVTVASAGSGENVRCYVDGWLGGTGSLDVRSDAESRLPVKIGFCNDDFPRSRSYFLGDLDEVCWYSYALSDQEVRELFSRGR